jgi:hypothetical protein
MDRYVNATETRNIYGSNTKLTYINEYTFRSHSGTNKLERPGVMLADAKTTSKTYAVSNTSP